MIGIKSFATEEFVIQNEEDVFLWAKKIQENKKVFYDGRVTAISTCRRAGKTQFILDSVKMLAEDRIAEVVNIYVVTEAQKKLMIQALDESFPDWKNCSLIISVVTANSPVWAPSIQCRTVNFVDEAYYQPEKVIEALAFYGNHDTSSWILLSSGLYVKRPEKNPFKACFNLPFIRTYDVKMSEGYFKRMNLGSAPLEAGDFVIKGYND
jgi:hypothetical protein